MHFLYNFSQPEIILWEQDRKILDSQHKLEEKIGDLDVRINITEDLPGIDKMTEPGIDVDSKRFREENKYFHLWITPDRYKELLEEGILMSRGAGDRFSVRYNDFPIKIFN